MVNKHGDIWWPMALDAQHATKPKSVDWFIGLKYNKLVNPLFVTSTKFASFNPCSISSYIFSISFSGPFLLVNFCPVKGSIDLNGSLICFNQLIFLLPLSYDEDDDDVKLLYIVNGWENDDGELRKSCDDSAEFCKKDADVDSLEVLELFDDEAAATSDEEEELDWEWKEELESNDCILDPLNVQ